MFNQLLSYLFRKCQKTLCTRYYGLKEFGEPDKDRLNQGVEINLEFKGQMRDKQKPIIKALWILVLHDRYIEQSIIWRIKCTVGWGKTKLMSLYILSQLKRKTLIIVHKEFLIEQWVERINEFLPDARIGRIQQKKVGYIKKI